MPTAIPTFKYMCDFCGEMFESKGKCEYHEYDKHKCPQCEHSYYVYGCEFNCALENKGKKCKYTPKTKKETT